jgi:hypothetical protein
VPFDLAIRASAIALQKKFSQRFERNRFAFENF